MNNQKFKSDKAALIAESKRIASSSDDAKFFRKVAIVNLMFGGMKAKALAAKQIEPFRHGLKRLTNMALSHCVRLNSLVDLTSSRMLKKKKLKSPLLLILRIIAILFGMVQLCPIISKADTI